MEEEIKKVFGEDLFQCRGYVQNISTLVDGGIKLAIITPDLAPEQAVKLFELKGKEGYFALKADPITARDMLKAEHLPELEFKPKSKAVRLRNVLYRVWETTSMEKTFDDYYDDIMEKLIERYKEMLPDKENGSEVGG